MAQAFITTTKNSYRWNKQEKEKLIKQERFYGDCVGKDVDWLTHEDLGEKKEDFDKIEASVKQLQVKRMTTTTYKTDYCTDRRKSLGLGPQQLGESFKNQLLESFQEIYKEKSGKILPSINSQRIVKFYQLSTVKDFWDIWHRLRCTHRYQLIKMNMDE